MNDAELVKLLEKTLTGMPVKDQFAMIDSLLHNLGKALDMPYFLIAFKEIANPSPIKKDKAHMMQMISHNWPETVEDPKLELLKDGIATGLQALMEKHYNPTPEGPTDDTKI